MSVHRLAKYQRDDPFTRVPNTAVNDERLDLKARGLLLLMLSLPDNWTFRERNLAEKAGVGREQVRTAMATLIEAGYVRRRREVVAGKPPVMITEVYDTAQDAAEVEKAEVGKPDRRETRPISNNPLRETNHTSNEATPSNNRKSRMTEDWTPDAQNVQRLKDKHRTVNVDREIENFRDYWISKGEMRADWNAGLRTWIRKAEEYATKRSPSSSDPALPMGSGGVYA